MASSMRILSILLLLGIISQCHSQECSMNDLSVSQNETGGIVQGKKEWSVTVTNHCNCVQKNVRLNCAGFQTVEEIDPSILSVSGDTCLVNGGQSIYKDPIIFKYAWDTSFPFTPTHSEIACS